MTITLEETETVCLLDIPTVSVSTNSEKANAVSQSNEKYKTVRLLRFSHSCYNAHTHTHIYMYAYIYIAMYIYIAN